MSAFVSSFLPASAPLSAARGSAILPRAVPAVGGGRGAGAARMAVEVEIKWQGKVHRFAAPEDQNLLETMEENGLYVDNSCRAGVCITCAAKLISGEIDQSAAALAPEVESKGFVLTCSAYPVSGPIKLEMSQFDTAYDMQYGVNEAGAAKKEEKSGGFLGGMFGKK